MEAADLEATRLPVLAGAKAEVAATNAQAMKARRIVDREAIMFLKCSCGLTRRLSDSLGRNQETLNNNNIMLYRSSPAILNRTIVLHN